MEAGTDLHTYDLDRACEHFAVTAENRYIFNALAAADGMAGLALAHQLRGEEQAAVEASHELQAFARELREPLYLSVAESSRARLALLQGDLTSAAQWAKAPIDVPGPADLSIWIEVPAITQARVFVAMATRESLARAAELLTKIRERTEARHFTCQTIEVVILQALAQDAQGQKEEALATLKHALALSRPGGWVRSFVEVGPRMWGMLRSVDAQEHEVGFIRRILTLAKGIESDTKAISMPTAPKTAADGAQSTIDSLTHREMDVLELLAQRLRSKEIASRLFISTNTVNDHLQRAYRKLGVGNRRQAVERAISLGIISSPPLSPRDHLG